jgi:hypothetical protein
MKPVRQTIFTNLKTGKLGNCFAACIASLLEVPLNEVPRLEKIERTERNRIVVEFLARRGYSFESHSGMPPYTLHDYVIACFEIPCTAKVVHCVIWKDGKIVHDPRGKKAVPLENMVCYYTVEPKIKKMKPGTVVVLDVVALDPNYSEEERKKYYGYLGYGEKKSKCFVFICQILNAPDHCVLLSLDDKQMHVMVHIDILREATENEF